MKPELFEEACFLNNKIQQLKEDDSNLLLMIERAENAIKRESDFIKEKTKERKHLLKEIVKLEKEFENL